MKIKYKQYLYWGITSALVIMICIAFAFMIIKGEKVQSGITKLNQILAPISYGAIMAYLVCPIYNRCLKAGKAFGGKYFKNSKYANSFGKLLGSTISLIFLVVVILGLFWMIIPQIINSITTIVNSLPGNAERLSEWIQTVFANNAQLEGTILSLYNQGIDMLINWSTTDLMPNVEKVIGGVFVGVISIVNLLKNVLIGIIVMIYLLNIKDLFAAQAKKIVYGCFTLTVANLIIQKMRFIHKVFGGFIIGKLIDSFIIGVLCFLCLSVLKMPYVLLISVIIGVTNVIPFFGPFIGAIPSAILILMVDPMKCLTFIIFIFVLQQFDGNILGPKILGDSTGLSSFWVLFAILFFGGWLGPVGMVIGVPTFAVIYQTISELVSVSLKKKQLSVNTKDYQNLDYIDEDDKTYIK